MALLFVGTTGDHAGQTLATWALARMLEQKGLRVGYLKPFGSHPEKVAGEWTDTDALLFQSVLNLPQPLERICPFPAADDSRPAKSGEKIFREIKVRVREASGNCDVLLIMGSKHIFFDALSSPVPDITLIQELQSDVLLIDRYQDLSRSLYSIFSVSSLIPARLKGAILNRVPPPIVTEVRERITRSLADKALPRPAVLPESAWLSSRSLAAIKKLLGGKALSGAGALDQPVAGMTVGSRELKGELSLFRRVYNKLVLLKPAAVGGAEEEPGSPRTIAGILLTGGRKPPGALLEAAAKTGIPLVLVEADTFTAIEQLEEHPPHLFSSDESKVRRFIDLLDQAGGLPFMQEYPAR